MNNYDNQDIINCIHHLQDDITCVLCLGEDIHISREAGIKPLVDMIASGLSYVGYSAADKIVGKAAALLYIKLKIKAVHAHVMSTTAYNLLISNGICATYDISTERIINRQNTGLCPMEITVQDIDNPDEAYNLLLQKILYNSHI